MGVRVGVRVKVRVRVRVRVRGRVRVRVRVRVSSWSAPLTMHVTPTKPAARSSAATSVPSRCGRPSSSTCWSSTATSACRCGGGSGCSCASTWPRLGSGL